MIIIRTDSATSCDECGSAKELVECTVREVGKKKRATKSNYCNKCLNKFEKDEENYRILE